MMKKTEDKLKARRRSSSASRTLATTVNLVDRIGASLRISSRRKPKEKQSNDPLGNSKNDEWLRSGAHYARIGAQSNVGIERRRSTCSAVFFGSKQPRLYFADEELDTEEEPTKKHSKELRSFSVGEKTSFLIEAVEVDSVSEIKEKSRVHSSKSAGDFARRPSSLGDALLSGAGELDRLESPQFIDDTASEDEDDLHLDTDIEPNALSMALVPLAAVSPLSRSRRSSGVSGISVKTGSGFGGAVARSCPGTPQMQRRRYLKEGATQLTSLSTLCTHHRYLFLFNDLLLVSKQKGENSYKLKNKVNLDRLWISSNNCTHSFLIGWPIQNYIAHFSCESEKNEWFAKLSECIRRRFRPRTTTIGVSVRIEGRQQYIRQEVQNGRRASEIVQELIDTLDLPALDPHLHHYELCFETGKDVPANAHQPTSASGTVSGVPSAVATTASTGGLFHSGCTIRPLNGVENVYSILMDHVASAGLTLSDSQLAQLDTCPMTHCRLVLRQSSTSGGSSSRSNAALNFVNQFRKVLSRTESSSKRLFGRQLEGSMPPQPVLTMIDHLTMHAADIEGIFRKSPKQATVRVLKTQLDHGQVPDFHQFNVHVTASLLKEYLRSIPGQLLISGNYHLWMEMCDEVDPVKKLRICRNLLRLLPASHTVLLRSVVRLLRRIAANEETSKMSARSLAVCIAPSLLENPNIVDSARKVPELAVYLIEHATEIFDGFVEEGALLVVPKQNDQQQQDESEAARRLHQSTDSGLSDDAGTCGKQSAGSQNSKTALLGVSTTFSSSADPLPTAKSVSPDSALFESIGPMSDCSGDDESNKGNSRGDAVSKKPTQLSRESGVRIEEIESNENKALSRQNATADDESSADEDDGPTPTAVLSRENSDVKTQFPNRYQWKSHISTDPTTPLAQSNRSQPKTVYKGLTESDLVKSPSEVRILRLKPQSASPAASPSLSMASVNSERFRRLGAQGSSFVSNLDELRVSDYIISHKKIESTDSAKTLTLDFNTTPNKSRPSSASERNPSRKTSTNSNFSAVSETSNASERQHGALRRVNLLSKNESLGLSSDSRNRSTNISTPGSQTRPNSSSGTRNGGPLSSRQANNGSSQIARTPSNGNARSSSANLKRNNSINTSQVGIGLKSSRENLVQKVVQAPLSTGFASTTSTRFGTLDRKSASGNTTPGLVQQTGTIIRRENQTASKPTVTSNPSTPIARSYNSSGRGGSLKSPTASSENPYTAISKTNSANSNTQQKSSHTAPTTVSLARRSQVGPMRSNGGLVTKCSNGESPSHGGSRRTTGANSTLDRSASIPSKSTAWRPPKRTAEDIVLDKLEVNWSVPSIRSVFQQNKDVKPASIDTVYAKLPSSASAAGNQPAANNENLHKVPASQSVFGH